MVCPGYRAITVVESWTHSPLKSEAPVWRGLGGEPESASLEFDDVFLLG